MVDSLLAVILGEKGFRRVFTLEGSNLFFARRIFANPEFTNFSWELIFEIPLHLVSTGRIYVEPVSSLVMDSVIIKGDGFKKFSPVTIQASIKNETENIAFDSCGHFITNDSGAFNLKEAESLGGTYTGVSKMVFDGHLNETTTAEPFCTAVVKRYFTSKDIERYPIRAGNIRVMLFSPPGDGPFPAIVTLNGGIKQKSVVEDSAAILANYGFVTLALAYFGVDDLPRSYQTVRIEYFEEAVNYLEGRADVIPSAIGVLGFSNGGSIGLGMMSLFG
ncbi:acyl-coenzyme A amino acid N-acyltransferase 1-like [Hydractinia symbiolongicarpus]|uniref:acyl-coenzyme A amino acid N-acyltransferase 1-like n=1 Tax=Hydractinia symbiolongicarpus TaxID=13093 RepID=UPI00254FD4AA|nr:acyl-coenzyme A amino acid N-acyltransferase 1-like [Hydractinia symbiolongicarpus]